MAGDAHTDATGAARARCIVCHEERQAPATLIECNTCRSRLYCSHECILLDQPCHGRYCHRAGQRDRDLEILECGAARGLGIFAKRDFWVGKVVLVETAQLIGRGGQGLKECTLRACRRLVGGESADS